MLKMSFITHIYLCYLMNIGLYSLKTYDVSKGTDKLILRVQRI